MTTRARRTAVPAVVLGLVVAAATPALSAETATLGGTVASADGGSPVGLCVSTWPAPSTRAGGSYRVVQVQSDGTWSASVDPGGYALSVGPCGPGTRWASTFLGDADHRDASPRLEAIDGAVTSRDLVAPLAGSIAGRVLDTDGQPAATCVRAQRQDRSELFRFTTTGDDGRYALAALPAGPIRVHFGDCGGDGSSDGQWWPGADAFDAAGAVTVTAGATAPDVDGVVRTYGRLTGLVRDADGDPVEGAVASLSALSGGFNGQSASSGPDGRWTIDRVRPSSYGVTVTPPSTQPDLLARQVSGVPPGLPAPPVVVLDGVDVDTGVLVLPRGARVTGRVTDPSGAPVPGIAVNGRTTGPDGRYELRGVEAGPLLVKATRGAAGNWAPAWAGSDDHLPPVSPRVVATGETVDGVDLVVRPGARASGRVVDASGRPLTGITVSSYSDSYGAVQELASTGDDGSYLVEGLPQDDRHYLTFRDPTGTHATEHTGDAALTSRATTLVLRTGTTTQVPDAVLDRAGSVSGTVTDARTGLRTGQVGVELLDPATLEHYAFTSTDGEGRYDLRGAKPGAWLVRFYDFGANVAVPEYWDDALVASQATTVQVVAGEGRAGIDAAVLLLTVPTVPLLDDVTAGVESALLAWRPPVDDGSASLDAFEVVDETGRVLTTVPGTAAQARVDGLPADVTHHLAVRAVNRKGPGPATELRAVVPQRAASPTATPGATASASPSATPSVGPGATGGPSQAATPSASPSPTAGPTSAGDLFTPLTPARLLDTRSGNGLLGRFAPNVVRDLAVTGRGGVPTSGVTAVVLSTTVTAASAPGHLTVFPGGTGTPLASNLNHVAGQTVANLVTVPVGPGGTIRLRSSGGSPHVVADVVGWYGPAGAVGFAPVSPSRLLDTRASGGRVLAGSPVRLPVAGRAGLPSQGVRAVVLNLTATGGLASGHVTAYAGGVAPTASSLNFARGSTTASLAVVPVAPDGTVALAASAGSPYLLADVVGWYGEGATGRFHGVAPTRLLDTRGASRVAGSLALPVASRGGLPANGASAVVLNLTATGATGPGHVTAHPAAGVPSSSSLNFVRGATVPNLAVVPVGADGAVRLTAPTGAPHLLADVVGWFD